MQLPKRLARRLMDLQFLPYIVVTNPHIKKVYDSYRHAFDTLHNLPQVKTMEQNADFTILLKRLVDEHGQPAVIKAYKQDMPQPSCHAAAFMLGVHQVSALTLTLSDGTNRKTMLGLHRWFALLTNSISISVAPMY